jgi:glycosyltransferase involved in cell wall biosynthesis
VKLYPAAVKIISSEEAMTVWFASRFGPTYQGGLAAEERSVIRGVQHETCTPVKVICATTEIDSLPTIRDYGEFPLIELQTSWFGRLSKPLWARLASKVLLHGILESILSRAWRTPQIPKPSVIHYLGTGWDFFGFAVAKFAQTYRARLVITPAIHPGSWGDDRIDARLYQRADSVICHTEHESLLLQNCGVPSQKISICGLPPMCRPDGDGLRFRTERNLGDRPAVLFIGRRDEGKGFPALLKAWSLVLRNVPDAVLILAGPGGEQYSEILKTIPERNVCDLGLPDEMIKANAIAACDVFCLPSAHESFGIVYVEAWSYSKPVVCGTAPACREFIVDGKSGLWASQIPEELAEKLTGLLQNRDMQIVMGRAGKIEQSNRFNQETFLQVHLAALGLTRSKTPPGVRPVRSNS